MLKLPKAGCLTMSGAAVCTAENEKGCGAQLGYGHEPAQRCAQKI